MGLGGFLPDTGAEAWVKDDMGTPAEGTARLFGVAAGDGDGDGAFEAYFTDRQNGGVFEYSWNATAGSWDIANIAPGIMRTDALVLGDGDDSGDAELYFTGVSQAFPRARMAVYTLWQDGSGWHQETVAATSSQAMGNRLAIGDGNDDSRKEIFGCTSDGHIYMYTKTNDWNGQDIGSAPASPGGPGQPGVSMEGLAVGDGDNDGHPEVWGSDSLGRVHRFAYTGSSWVRTDVGSGEQSKQGSNMAAIAVGDVDGDGSNEVYGASWANATIYSFGWDANSSGWKRTSLVSLGSGVNALSLTIGDGDSDGGDELYAGTNKNQVYSVFIDEVTGDWARTALGSGNGPINDVAVGATPEGLSQKAVYAACQDGHAYRFLVDRTPPANPTVTSDTHPVPGTWYAASVVHVLWQDVGADSSGIDGYSFSWDGSPSTVPDDRKEVEESVREASSPALSPGKWYFHIRARDNSLNWNASASHFGPACIGTAPDTDPPLIYDLRVSGVTDRLAVVSWRTSEPADSAVDYGRDVSYGLRGTDANLTLEHAVALEALSPSTTYHCRASSHDGSGNPATSADLAFTTLAAPDTSAPVISNIRVSGITDRLAVISWETDEPADGSVEYGLSASHGSAVSEAGLTRLHELTLSGLNSSTVYHFRVLSTDATGNGPSASGDRSFSTLSGPDITPPTVLNVRTEGVTSDGASVLWETDEPAGSFVEYGPTPARGLSTTDLTFKLVHSLSLRGLEADTTYHFRVLSSDPSGNTGSSAVLTFRTSKVPARADTTPPVISGAGASGVTDTRAVIIWYTDELADGEVEYGPTPSYGLRASDPARTLFHGIALSGLSPATDHHFRVRSTDASGNGPSSSADITFRTAGNPDTAAPVMSSIRVVNITRTGATIAWTTDEPSTSTVEHGNGTSYGRKVTSQLFVLEHAIVLTGLAPKTAYHFRVQSADPTGNLASPSADRTFTTLEGGASPATRTEGFPWWLAVLALALVPGIPLAFLAFRRSARRMSPPSAGGGAPPPAGAGAGPAFGEEVETLQMDDGPAFGTGGPGYGFPPDRRVEPASGRAAPGPGAPAATGRPPTAGAVVPSAPLPGAAPEPEPLRHVRCPTCRTRIPLFHAGPQEIACPGCGRSGMYRPRGS